MRDTQRQKVYNWERRFHCDSFEWRWTNNGHRARISKLHELPLNECQALATKVSNFYCRAFPPRITDGRGCRRASWHGYSNEMKLPRWSRQPQIVLHESAHMITPKLFGRVPCHGREFVGVMMFLMVKYLKTDIKELVRTANEARVDFISQTEVKKAQNYLRVKARQRAA